MVGDGLGSDVGINPELVYLYTKAAKKGTTLPVLAKMTPNITTMLPPALRAVEAGADGLADLCLNAKIVPAVNQVELHPFFAQNQALDTMKEFHIQAEAWGPMAEGKHGIFKHPILTEIGQKYGKTAAQVALKWNVQRGVVIIPKTTHRERMEENLDIWNFNLTEDDMDKINALDIGHSEIVDHSSAETAKWLNGWKIHN